jgi:hypothetical protein
LEVEEEGLLSREEGRGNIKQARALSLGKDPYSPFYMPRGAGYMSRESERVSSCMLNRCAGGKPFPCGGSQYYG